MNASGYVMETSIYGGRTNWPPVCLYDENSAAFKKICNPTEPLQTAPEFMQVLRCPPQKDCNPQTNPKWPSQTETKTVLESINQYRTSSNSIFNKYNMNSFSNYLEGWDPGHACDMISSSSLPFCPTHLDKIPRRLHNLVREVSASFYNNYTLCLQCLVPASKNFTLNCRYRYCKQKSSGAGTGTHV